MLDPARIQGNVGGLFHHRFCTRQRRTRRQLHQADEIALVLLGNEARLRMRELPCCDTNQPHIDHEHDRGAANQPARCISIPVRQALKAAIKASKSPVQQPLHEIA